MHGIEIPVQNSKQILNVIVKTQPHVIDLKGPVNKGFNQSSFVVRRCKAYTVTLFLNKTIAHNVVKDAYKFIRTHKKKLKNLTRNSVLPFTSSKVVTDLSSFVLTLEQLDALKFGPTHSICPHRLTRQHLHVL